MRRPSRVQAISEPGEDVYFKVHKVDVAPGDALCRNGATTAWLLKVMLGMPETTSPRVLKQLMAMDFVELVIRIPRRRLKRSGSIPKVWGARGN